VQPLVAWKVPKDPPSPYAKRKLKRYYDYLIGDGEQPGISNGVRDRILIKSPKKRKKLQKQLGQDALPSIKYIWAPTVMDQDERTPLPVEVIYQEGEEPDILTTGDVSEMSVEFEIDDLIDDMEEAVRDAMAYLRSRLPKGVKAVVWIINNGAFRLNTDAIDERGVIAQVRSIMNRYPITRGKRWFGLWLHGLTVKWSRTYRPLNAYRAARLADSERRKKVRKYRLDYLNVLSELRHGGLPASVISQRVTGHAADPAMAATLNLMRRYGLIFGDDNKWMITSAGRTYYTNGADAYPHFH